MPPSRKNHGDLGSSERIKAALILETNAADQIDAMVLGEDDWRLGSAWLQEQVATHQLPVLAANLTCDGVAPFPSNVVVERDGLKVGIIGVTQGEVPGCEVADPLASVPAALASLGEVDFVVGLLPLRLARIEDGDDLGIDLAVTGGEPVKYDDLVPWRGGFKAGPGGQTKHVGIVRLERVPGATEWAPDPTLSIQHEMEKTAALRDRVADRLEKAEDEPRRERYREMLARYDEAQAEREGRLASIRGGDEPATHLLVNEVVPLDEHLEDHPATLARVTAAKARVTAAATGGEDLAALTEVPHLIPGGGAFAGSDSCAGCHAEQHTQWSRTGHARAYKSLVDVDRAMDPECFSCHITGANLDGGPANATLVGPYRDVQCEACHGPSGAHARDPAAHLPNKVPMEATCETCHDGNRDMGRFEFERYLKRVSH